MEICLDKLYEWFIFMNQYDSLGLIKDLIALN